MSLGSSLFLLLMLLCLLILGIMMTPMQLCLSVQHQIEWRLKFSIQIWNVVKTFQMPEWTKRKLDGFLQKTLTKEDALQHSFKIHWKPAFSFLHQAIQIASQRLELKQLLIHCRIGMERADYTAYFYGLFWVMLSFLPVQWQKNSEIVYIPDFQTQKKEIRLEGIICCRVGQFIGILIAWFRLTVKLMLEMNRKEQNVYEN